MRAYIDLATLQIQRRLSGYPVTSLPAKRGASCPLEIQFVRDCAVVDLGADASLALSDETGAILTTESGDELTAPEPVGILGLKAQGDFQGNRYVVSGSWEKSGSGSTALYTFTPAYTGVRLDSLLGNADSATLGAEIQWSVGDAVFKTVNAFEVEVQNAVIRGGETAQADPASAPLLLLTAITRLTGGVTPTDLDALPLAAYAPGTIFVVVTTQTDGSQSESRWEKRAGSQATSVAAGYIRTLDFESVTNPYVLARVAGL